MLIGASRILFSFVLFNYSKFVSATPDAGERRGNYRQCFEKTDNHVRYSYLH